MSPQILRSLMAAGVAAVLLVFVNSLGLELSVLAWGVLLAALVVVAVPRLALDAGAWLWDRLRAAYWAGEQGQHHRHRGLVIQVEDDGQHVWLAGRDLQAQLGSKDSDDVLAARHAGHWRRDADGRLMLRADAVVRHLAAMPGRGEARIIRLRRYIERDIIYPAQRRHERHL
jgi:hypothetical protein